MKSYFKKGIVLGTIILFLGAGVVSGTNIDKKNAGYDITYVDDDYIDPEPPYYNYIQDGVDNVNPSGTVYVYSGNYTENIIIKKPLNLIGSHPDNTTIDGSYLSNVIRVAGSYSYAIEFVKITGFTIKNSSAYDCGILLEVSLDSEISKCRIINNYIGISAVHTSFDDILDNIISKNYYGVYMEFADNALIQNNFFHENNCGILIDTCVILQIQKNDIRKNNQGVVMVRNLDMTDKYRVTLNNFIDNSKVHAVFENARNFWNGNYWENPSSIGRFYVIKGVWIIWSKNIRIPWIQIDWNCAEQKHDDIKPW